MQADLAALLTEAKVPDAFVKFLESVPICSVDDFVWAAGNDSNRVDSEIIAASAVSGLTLADKIAVRKAWWGAS